MSSERRAIAQASMAYMWWGTSAIFWNALGAVAPIDQLSWRVTTAFLYLAIGGFIFRRRLRALGVEASLFAPGGLRAHMTRQHLSYGIGAAVMIVANWGLFLWAVDAGQAVEAALGYFLMPILSVAIGVGLLGERLRPLQVGALVLSVIGIIWTVAVLGSLPLVAIFVAVTFAIYGLLRKQGPWDAISGLTFETGLLVPFVVLSLAVRRFSGNSIFADGSLSTATLILLTGVVTMVPLIAFASASKRVPLSVLGLLQYINPTLQFLVGWRVLGESVTTSRLVGFAWIWVALILIVMDELNSKRPINRVAARADKSLVDQRERLAPKEAPVSRQRRRMG